MKAKSKKVLLSVPEPLLRKIDAVRARTGRDRSSEVCLRLAESLKEKKLLEVAT
jgi:metal-responsive CopG/Arc/MetJ family transcriptional regulator